MGTMRRIVIIMVCFMSFIMPTFAESTYFENWVSTEISLDDNLSTSTANQILQTDDKYIWFATYNGLVKYDGSNYITYNAYHNPDFDANGVRGLYEDSKHRLWIGTNGSGVFYYKDGQFYGLHEEDPLRFNMILGIDEDADGQIWIGGPEGLHYLYESDQNDLYSIIVNKTPLKDMCIDDNNTVWGVSSDGELLILEGKSWVSPQGLMSVDTCQFECVEYLNDQIWAGCTDDKLLRYGPEGTWTILNGEDTFGLESYGRIRSDKDHNIWFSADNGIGYYNSQQEAFINVNDQNLPVLHAVESVIKDHEGSLWISSSRSGVVKLSAGKFNNITPSSGLSNEVVNVVLYIDDQMWVGTDSGLTILENGRAIENELTSYLSEQRIRHIIKDSEGIIWICTYGDLGLVKYDQGLIQHIDTDNGLSYNKTRVALEDSKGNIWVGTKSGLNKIQNERVSRIIDASTGLTNDYILGLYEDHEGRMMVGSNGGGIYIIDHNDILNITTDDGLASNIVYGMSEDENERLWVLTSKGISLIRGDTIDSISTLRTLGINSVFQILETEDGTLWLGTAKGVYTTKKEAFLALFDGERLEEPLNEYTVEDGMLDGITALSHSVIRDGVLTFCTTSGISILDTKSGNKNEVVPTLAMTGITVDGNGVSYSEKFNIDRDVRRIRFDFTTLSYVDPGKIEFKYMLEGYDEEWSSVTKERSISYTNLPAGDYRFLLMGTNNDGLWSDGPLAVKFYKEPELLERPSVILGISLFILLVTYGIYAYRIRDMKKHQEELKKLMHGTVLCLSSAIDEKDPYTIGHSNRVAKYAVLIAEEMELNKDFSELVEYAALLHDVGKISTPDSILMKDEELLAHEYEIIKKHPKAGWRILEKSSAVRPFAYGAKYHHEWFDGSGYCEGISGEAIPLEARIIAVADAFDVMISERPYKPAQAIEIIKKELQKNSGIQFDPQVVDALLRVLDKGKINRINEEEKTGDL